MAEAIEEVLLSIILHHLNDFLLDVFDWNSAFEWLLRISKTFLDLVFNSLHVDKLISMLQSHLLSNRTLTWAWFAKDDSIQNFLSKLLIEYGVVPVGHCLKSILLLEERINCKQVKVIALDFYYVAVLCWVNDGRYLCTVCFKLFGLFDDVRETAKDEFV